MNAYHAYVFWFVLIGFVGVLLYSCVQPAESYELWEKAWRETQR